MKKTIIAIFFMMFFASQVCIAKSFDVNTVAPIQDRMNRIGVRILNSNRIEQRVCFKYLPNQNSYNVFTDMKNLYIRRYVYLTPLEISYISDDEEMAALLSRRISQTVDSYEGVVRGYGSMLNYWVKPQKYNNKADKMAVDYMVNSGYNPLALIVIISKATSQRRFEYYDSYSLSSRRMARIYEYIYTKYPAFLADNQYSDNIYYQNFLLTSRANRAKLQNKIETKSNKKVRYK